MEDNDALEQPPATRGELERLLRAAKHTNSLLTANLEHTAAQLALADARLRKQFENPDYAKIHAEADRKCQALEKKLQHQAVFHERLVRMDRATADRKCQALEKKLQHQAVFHERLGRTDRLKLAENVGKIESLQRELSTARGLLSTARIETAVAQFVIPTASNHGEPYVPFVIILLTNVWSTSSYFDPDAVPELE